MKSKVTLPFIIRLLILYFSLAYWSGMTTLLAIIMARNTYNAV